jgi:hypothetical protein
MAPDTLPSEAALSDRQRRGADPSVQPRRPLLSGCLPALPLKAPKPTTRAALYCHGILAEAGVRQRFDTLPKLAGQRD